MTRPLAGTVLLVTLVVGFAHAQSGSVLISGRVVADDTQSPLAHARIVIYNDALPIASLFSDADGRFAIASLRTGRYRLSASKAGYVEARIAPIQPGRQEEIRLVRSAAVLGRVYDMFGDPVIGLPVMIFPSDGGPTAAAAKTVTTDDLGEYRIGGLARGPYVVAITQFSLDDEGWVSRKTAFFPNLADREAAQVITVRAGDQRGGVDFAGATVASALAALLNASGSQQLAGSPQIRLQLPVPRTPTDITAPPAGTGTIRGRITRADGLGVPRATVIAQPQRRPDVPAPPNALAPRSVATDDDGSYEITELWQADYRIRATKPGYVDATYGQSQSSQSLQSLQGEQPALVSIGVNQTRTRIDFLLPRNGSITGDLVDDFGDPVEGATVNLWQIRFQSGRRRLVSVGGASTAISNDLGQYRLFGIPPGQYVITATVGQVSTVPGGSNASGFAPTYFPGTMKPAEARLVPVSRSQDVVGADFALVAQPTASIVGVRIGSDGEPMGGSLNLTPSQRSGFIVTPASSGARLSQDGRFEFPNVPPGEYVIQSDTGKRSAEREGDFASQLVVVNGADVTGVLLQAAPGSTISGRVVFEGDPPANFRGMAVEPSRADGDRAPASNGSIARAIVQPDLTFMMEGVHGPRRLIVDRPPAGWMMKSVSADGIDVTDAAMPFGTRDQSLSNVEIVLTSRVTEIAGTVTDSRGQPTPKYSLLLFPVDRDRWYSGSRFFRRTGAQPAGNFSARGLPPGDYYVAPVSDMNVLREGADAWQDPEVLDSLALVATHVTLAEGQKLSVNPRLITR